MKRNLNSKKGFTLIELIVSLAIFAIASVMLITLIITAMQISVRASAKAKTHLKSAEIIESGNDGIETVDPENQGEYILDGGLRYQPQNSEDVKLIFTVIKRS